MTPPSATADAVVEWRYDARSSRFLRVVAHGFVAGMGGALLLALGTALVTLPAILPRLGTGPLLLAVVLFLVGGPLSLLYLWPVLTDPDQRPSPTAFTWDDERVPWTRRSFVVAVLAGASLQLGLVVAGVPFDAVFALVVAAIFSPVVVALFTTTGTIESDRLVSNGASASLERVSGVRSLRIGNAVVYWVSYAHGTGVFVPRLLTVPVDQSTAVRSALERGVALDGEPPDSEVSDPDHLVQVVLGVAGLLFLGVAGVAAWAADDPVVGLTIGGPFGVIGLLLSIAAWRGV